MPPPRGPANPRKKFGVKPGFSMLVGSEGRLLCDTSVALFLSVDSKLLLMREETHIHSSRALLTLEHLGGRA